MPAQAMIGRRAYTQDLWAMQRNPKVGDDDARLSLAARDSTPAPARGASLNASAISAFIWQVADMLRGDYKQSDYGKVILPFTLLRRLDCVLAPTRDKVLAEQKKRRAQKVPAHEFLLKTVNVPMAINPDLKALIPGSRIDSGFLAWALRGTK